MKQWDSVISKGYAETEQNYIFIDHFLTKVVPLLLSHFLLFPNFSAFTPLFLRTTNPSHQSPILTVESQSASTSSFSAAVSGLDPATARSFCGLPPPEIFLFLLLAWTMRPGSGSPWQRPGLFCCWGPSRPRPWRRRLMVAGRSKKGSQNFSRLRRQNLCDFALGWVVENWPISSRRSKFDPTSSLAFGFVTQSLSLSSEPTIVRRLFGFAHALSLYLSEPTIVRGLVDGDSALVFEME